MSTELHDLSIAELSGLISAQRLSPVELVDALIARIDRYDGQTHAFITCTFELARLQARAAEAEIAAGTYRGPLHGIPLRSEEHTSELQSPRQLVWRRLLETTTPR